MAYCILHSIVKQRILLYSVIGSICENIMFRIIEYGISILYSVIYFRAIVISCDYGVELLVLLE